MEIPSKKLSDLQDLVDAVKGDFEDVCDEVPSTTVLRLSRELRELWLEAVRQEAK
jgi:hypothetical protein